MSYYTDTVLALFQGVDDTCVRKIVNTSVRKTNNTGVWKAIDTVVRKTIDTGVWKTIDTGVRKAVNTDVRKAADTSDNESVDTGDNMGRGNCIKVYPLVKLSKYTYTLIHPRFFPQKCERDSYFYFNCIVIFTKSA